MRTNFNFDYSSLFSSLGSSSSRSSGSSTFGINLADYASIKNGSYGKLMKAYYGKNSSNISSLVNTPKNPASKDDAKVLAKLQTETDALKESADALLQKGNKSLFTKKDITVTNEDGTTTTKNDYDVNAILKGVKAFVDDYNDLVKSGSNSKSDSIVRQTNNMITNMNAYAKSLEKIGISIDSDNKLSIDEDTFKKANMDSVKSLFNTTGSIAYQASAKASQIGYTAIKESEKNNTYNFGGSYNNNFNTGNLYNSYF